METDRMTEEREALNYFILKPIKDETVSPFKSDDSPEMNAPKFVDYYMKGKEYYRLFGEAVKKEAALSGLSDYNEIAGMDLRLLVPESWSCLRNFAMKDDAILLCKVRKSGEAYYAEFFEEEKDSAYPLFEEKLYFPFHTVRFKLFLFLEYCVKKDIGLSLIGHMMHDNAVFRISNIIMGFDPNGYSMKKNPYEEEGLLQPVKRKVLRKLLREDVDIYDMEYDTQAQCSMIIEFFRDYYPDDVSTVILKALKDQERRNIASSARMQEMATALGLVNVDWRIHGVRYPTLPEIREKLDREFYGIESVKKRILEIFARLRSCNTVPKWGILLQGPPGVGKTSIVQFFTELLRSPVIYLDTSSVQDSTGIVGSSRIYKNGQPGVIMREIIGQNTAQQTMVINEIDKLDNKAQNALLSLLDRKGYTDANIDYPIALTGLTFIATCNDLSKINEPVLDRFEIIELLPYTNDEKQHIFTDYIFPSLLKRAGLSASELSVEGSAVETLCRYYAKDCGVRDLEKYGERIIDDYLLSADIGAPVTHCYGMEKIKEIIGQPKCTVVHMANTPGVVRTVTVKDGKIINNMVEARVVPGDGKITIIGAPGRFTVGHITTACHYAASLGWFPAEKTDILLRLQAPEFDSFENTLGLAVVCAIFSDVNGTVFDDTFAAIGGVTLHGCLFYDGDNIDAIASLCEESEIKRILCPVGCTENLSKQHNDISLIEAYDAASLLASINQLT